MESKTASKEPKPIEASNTTTWVFLVCAFGLSALNPRKDALT